MDEKYKEMMEFLAKDEEEAIKGYDDVIAKLDANDPVVAQLKKIRDEEEAHLNFLREAKENPDAKYVDPSDDDMGDEELVEASKLFKMNLGVK